MSEISPAGRRGDGELRASHADRDTVVEQLRVAGGDGRLTPEELDERLEAALPDTRGAGADQVARPGTVSARPPSQPVRSWKTATISSTRPGTVQPPLASCRKPTTSGPVLAIR